MMSRNIRTGVRIAGTESAAQLRPTNVSNTDRRDEDERDRDWRPGRYAVMGPFIDLTTLNDFEADVHERRGA
jgi:hypothetical protein